MTKETLEARWEYLLLLGKGLERWAVEDEEEIKRINSMIRSINKYIKYIEKELEKLEIE